MKIATVGHLHRLADPQELKSLLASFENIEIVFHSGFTDFDRQISDLMHEFEIQTQVDIPQYYRYGRGAPMMRNQRILRECDCLIALYDGRPSGVVATTIKEAHRLGKLVFTLRPIAQPQMMLEFCTVQEA